MAIKAAKAKKATKKVAQAPPPTASSSSSSSSDSSSEDEAPPARKSEVAQGKQRESEDDESYSASSSGDEESEDEAEPLLDLDKIRKRMHYAVRHLASSAKKVRKFETQRLIKRIKSSPPDLASLETQLTALKSLDMVSLASTALLGKLGKAKLLPRGATAKEYRTEDAKSSQSGQAEWPLLAGVWSEDPLAEAWLASAEPTTGPQDEAGKVKARLLSSKVLADECGKMVETLGRLAGRSQNGKAEQPAKVEAVEDPLPEPKGKATAPKKVEMEDERIWSGSEGESSDSDDDQSELEEDSESDDDDDAAEDLDEDAMQAKLAELGDLDKWDALVAAGSDEDADDGSDAEEQQAGPSSSSKRKRSLSPRPALAKKRQAAQVAEPSSSEGEEVDSEEDPEADSDDDDGSSSSYGLPALSHGFLAQRLRTKDDDFSGSESGSDDDDPIDDQAEDKAAKVAKGSKASKERKNRMGQRARKALWEKKYGRNANHVKLQQKDKKPRPDASEGRPAFKPLRRGRDGKVLPDFEAPKELDSGWKKFPVAAAPADAAPSASATKGKRPDASAPPRKALRPQQNTYVPKGDYRMDTNGAASGPSRAKTVPAAPQQEMHPSWVAKQKQKEKEEMIARSLAGGGGAGKKVTFD